MPARQIAAVPVAPRKTLLEWIEQDDGDDTNIQPVCNEQDRNVHFRIATAIGEGRSGAFEPIQPPPGLHLAPLG